MHSFEVSLVYESVDRTTFSTCSASLKMYFGQRFHTPMKLQKNAFNSYITLRLHQFSNVIDYITDYI